MTSWHLRPDIEQEPLPRGMTLARLPAHYWSRDSNGVWLVVEVELTWEQCGLLRRWWHAIAAAEGVEL